MTLVKIPIEGNLWNDKNSSEELNRIHQASKFVLDLNISHGITTLDWRREFEHRKS